MSERLTCALCGATSHEVAWRRLVEWTDEHRRRSPDLPRWDAVDRCLDYQACRSRVESTPGAGWPVRDAVTRPTVTPSAPRQEVAV